MKKLLFTFLSCLAATAGYAQAVGEVFTHSDVTYQIIDAENKEVSVTGASFQNTTVLTIPAAVPYKLANYSVTKIQGGFKGNETITGLTNGSNLRMISDESFSGCTKLASVSISSENMNWGKGVFSNCTALTKASINGSIAEASGLFSGCKALTTVAFGDNIGNVIPEECFSGCNALTEVNNIDAIREISPSAFRYTSALENLEFPVNLKKIGDYAFTQSGLTNAVINADVELGSCVFMSGKLKSITFGEGTTIIPDGTCEGCAQLTAVNMPKSLESIGNKAFRYDSALERVVIPTGVENIGSEAFNECRSLKTVISLPSTPPEMTDKTSNVADYVFPHDVYQNATLYVNENSLEDYKNAFIWQNFRNIEGVDPTLTSVEKIEEHQSAVEMFYNLNGVRVNNPENGIYIRIKGDKVDKVRL